MTAHTDIREFRLKVADKHPRTRHHQLLLFSLLLLSNHTDCKSSILSSSCHAEQFSQPQRIATYSDYPIFRCHLYKVHFANIETLVRFGIIQNAIRYVSIRLFSLLNTSNVYALGLGKKREERKGEEARAAARGEDELGEKRAILDALKEAVEDAEEGWRRAEDAEDELKLTRNKLAIALAKLRVKEEEKKEVAYQAERRVSGYWDDDLIPK